jgi:hypothetical protein
MVAETRQPKSLHILVVLVSIETQLATTQSGARTPFMDNERQWPDFFSLVNPGRVVKFSWSLVHGWFSRILGKTLEYTANFT